MAPVILLGLFWVFLWGDVSVGNLAAGIVIAIAVELAFPRGAPVRHRIRPVAASVFGAHMTWNIVVASLRVMAAVLRPTEANRRVSMIDVALTSSSPSVRSVTVNTISLTPGTLTIDLDPESHVITVHVLGQVDEEEFRRMITAHEQRIEKWLVPVARKEKGR